MAGKTEMAFVDGQWAVILGKGDEITFNAPDGQQFTTFAVTPSTGWNYKTDTTTEKTLKVKDNLGELTDVSISIDLGDGLTNSRSMLRLKP